MNFKTTGVLVVLLIVVLAAWVFYPHSEGTVDDELTPPDSDGERQALFEPQPDREKIVRVTVERPDRPQLVFVRAPREDRPDELGDWEALEPLAVPVQTYTVDALVRTLTTLESSTRFAAGPKDAPTEADAGLAPPVATVTLVDQDDQVYPVEVGRKAAISNDTYVRVAGEQSIHVVALDLPALVKKEFDEYRDKKLLAFKPNEAVRAELTVGGRAYVFTRGDDNAWVIDKPVKAYAEGSEVQTLLRAISGLRAEEFVDDAPADLASYGLAQPYVDLVVTTETKRALPRAEDESTTQPAEQQFETVTEQCTLAVGDFADMQHTHRYARRTDQPWVVSLTQESVEKLLPDLVKLRDSRIARIGAGDATRVELTAGGMTATLDKVDGVWRGNGDLAEVEAAAVVDVLEAFEDLRAIDYVLDPDDLGQYGLDDPRATLTVTAGGTVTPVTLHVGDVTRSARNAYVLRDGQPSVFVVSAAQANRLAVTPLSLRSRQIFSGEVGRFRRLDIVRGAAGYSLERAGAEWQLVEPADAPLERVAVRALVGDLSRLRARRVVGKGDGARFGLDEPAITVRFALDELAAEPGPSETQPAAAQLVEHTLRVGRRNNVAYAQLDDNPFVFELDETVYNVLAAELISRRLFDFQPEAVTGVTIVTPEQTLELAKDGNEWKFPPDPFVKLSPEKVTELAGQLSRLRVERYSSYRGGDFEGTGLFTAPFTVSVRLVGGGMANLKIAPAQPGADTRLAGWVEEKRIFILRQSDCESLLSGLEHYLPAEGDGD